MAEHVYSIHTASIAKYGGLPGKLGRSDCVEGAIGNAELAVRYSGSGGDKSQALIMAGYTLFYLSEDHCFQDGNKRVAWGSAVEILRRIHYTLEVGEQEAIDYMEQVASGVVKDGSEVVSWLAERLRFSHPAS